MSENNFLKKLKEIFNLFVATGKGFGDNNCMKMSAALAYYTVFSIGPLILILIWSLGFLYGTQLEDSGGARTEVMDELNKMLGESTATTLEEAIQKISTDSQSYIGMIIGVATLIFTSTTIFVDIQLSINTIWGLKPKPKKGWLKMLINRLLSFSMILGLAFLLMVSLILSSVIGVVSTHLTQYLSWLSFDIDVLGWINTAITFIVITTLFGFIFAVLPDAKVRFKDILGGAIFTALLFMLGKYGISYYLSNNATASSFGAAGSIIVLLGWVYYSSAILYFGANFTKAYAMKYGNGIKPSSYAVVVEQTEHEYSEIPSEKEASENSEKSLK